MKTKELALVENSLTSNVSVDSRNNSQATPEEKTKKKYSYQGNISLGETVGNTRRYL